MAHHAANILLIETEEGFARKIRAMLQKRGHHIVVAGESRLALRLFLKHPSRYDAVVVDDRMPKAMGVPLVEGIVRVQPTIPVIVLFDGARAVPTSGRFIAVSRHDKPEELISTICRLFSPGGRLGPKG